MVRHVCWQQVTAQKKGFCYKQNLISPCNVILSCVGVYLCLCVCVCVCPSGPFVMTTEEEIRQAISDYQTGRNGFERAINWRSKIRDSFWTHWTLVPVKKCQPHLLAAIEEYLKWYVSLFILYFNLLHDQLLHASLFAQLYENVAQLLWNSCICCCYEDNFTNY